MILKVQIKNKNTLVLEEDGHVGDEIDLTSLTKVDLTNIEKQIALGYDEVYNQKLNECNHLNELTTNSKLNDLKIFYKEKLNELQNEITLLNTKHEDEMKAKIAEQKHVDQDEIAELKHQITLMKQKHESEIKNTETNLENKYQKEITSLKTEVSNLKTNTTIEVENAKLKEASEKTEQINALNRELDNLKAQHEIEKNEMTMANILELQKINENHEKAIKEKDEAYLTLQRQKGSYNVKITGEDLEKWCDNEAKAVMQNGFENCTWIKDTINVQEEGETKASKADFIFKIYASSELNDNELLASVCLEMKDENPNSTNRKTNADYYKQLDKNRIKKGCKYALLVSNLEADSYNDLSIYKVNGYENMYMVRPAYMMTFLNMVTSLTIRFKELILSKNAELLQIKDQKAFVDEFEAIKKTYLDNPLGSLVKKITEIRSKGEAVVKAGQAINELCDSVTVSYINVIQEKLSSFDVKLNKAYKKYII